MKTLQLIFLLHIIPTLALASQKPVYIPEKMMSVDELTTCLEDSLLRNRIRGNTQLVGLSEEYRWIMINALESPYEDVRVAGIKALSFIGDQKSVNILADYILKVQNDHSLVIITAEALSEMKADKAKHIISEILSTNENELVQIYLNNALKRIENPGYGIPLLENSAGYITLNFLVEDVKDIYYEKDVPRKHIAPNEYTPCFINRDDWPRLFRILLNSEVSFGFPVVELGALVIELSDGRKAYIIGSGKYYYLNESYYHYSNGFCDPLYFESKELMDFIKERYSKESN